MKEMRQVRRSSMISVTGIMVVAVMVVAMALSPVTSQAAVIFSEDFEDTGVADGDFVGGWPNTVFSGAAGVNLLNDDGTKGWLSPSPHPETGEIFATIYQDGTVTGNTGQKFTDGLDYTLTFTNFRRDGLSGGTPIRASIGNSAGALQSVDFAAVNATQTFETRTVSYTATSAVDGQDIYLMFADINSEPSNQYQAGIDNIVLIPEPASLGLFGIVCGALWFVRRRIHG